MAKEQAMSRGEMTRQEALANMLMPITWPWSSPINYRQSLVRERHRNIRLVLPFLNDEETSMAKTWLIEESHSELWD